MSLLRSSLLRLMKPANMTQSRQMSAGHSDADWKRWRTAFFVVACPAIVLAHVSAFVLPDASEHEPPPFVPYDHLRIRTKKFPWGDGNHSLIHNPHVNCLPDGFEHGDH